MKLSKTRLVGAILLLVAAIPALAMAQDAEFGEKMNKYLNEHPNMAAKVRANPSLLYDKQFREAHPELQQFMQTHPQVYERMDQRGLGAYDSSHTWRDANWWHQNDPGWAAKNHPEWAASHPEWAANHQEANHQEWTNNHLPANEAYHGSPNAQQAYHAQHHQPY
jgi:hypothetical protein